MTKICPREKRRQQTVHLGVGDVKRLIAEGREVILLIRIKNSLCRKAVSAAVRKELCVLALEVNKGKGRLTKIQVNAYFPKNHHQRIPRVEGLDYILVR